MNDLEARGIGFESLTEQIDTGSPAGKLVFHLFASLAEFERNLIRERTNAGIKAARSRGRIGGRPEKLTEKEKVMVRALAKAGKTPIRDIAAQFSVSRNTVHRVVTGSRSIAPSVPGAEAEQEG